MHSVETDPFTKYYIWFLNKTLENVDLIPIHICEQRNQMKCSQ